MKSSKIQLYVGCALTEPALAIAHIESKVTRLILGAAEIEPNLRFERYPKLGGVIPLVNEWLNDNNLLAGQKN
jgi:hypothetical protein